VESFDSAIGELYRELAPLLVRYAEGILGSRSDAEEAVQDAFLAASRAGRLEEPRPWLFRVTRNAAIDQLRRRRHLRLLEDGNGDRSVSAATDPHLRAELTAELEVLRRGLDRLGEQQRSALVLRELSGLGYREIASVLEVSEANVKVLIFRARRSLQEFALATRLSCDAAQLALSARADGEAGRTEAARARLHTASCSRCREFAGAVREQRIGLGMLVPVAGGHGVAAAAVHAVVGAKAGGGLGGLFGLKAAATAAVVVVFSTGAVVAVHDGVGSRHGGHRHPPLVPASGGGHTVAPVDGPQPGARVEDGSGVRDSSSGDGSGDGRGEASGDGSSGGSDSQTSDGGGSSGSDSQTSDGGGGDQSTQVQGSSSGEPKSSGSTSGGDGGGSSSGDG
jgi:RNA polymerase sigma factor (sigma-70 family)